MARTAREVACAHVYRKFPLLKGTRPSVRRAGPNRVYTFQSAVTTSPGGPSLRQVVRVTVDPAGSIVKVVVSK